MKDRILNLWSAYSVEILVWGKKLLISVLVAFVCILIARFVRKAIQKASRQSRWLDDTLLPVLVSTACWTIYAIGVIIILDIFGANTNSLIAVLGAAGLAIGLALKDTLGNVAAGIMLLVIRPFAINDYIECGTIAGKVTQTGLFVTTLETFDGLYVCAPNAGFWGASIKNYTRNGKRRLDVMVSIDYRDSVDTGLQVLRDIAAAETRYMREPVPEVMVHSMADSAVVILLRGWVKIDEYWSLYWDLNKLIKHNIEAAGLSIPFPQRTLHIARKDFAENGPLE